LILINFNSQPASQPLISSQPLAKRALLAKSRDG